MSITVLDSEGVERTINTINDLIAYAPSTQTTAAAILAKLSADPATQTTLAAVLAKIIAAPATEAKQDTLIAKDFATQTTLAAVLAKIIAAPATEAKQDTLLTKIDTLLAQGSAEAVSIFRSTDIDQAVDANQQVKGSAGRLYGGTVINRATSTRYLKFYDALHGSVTVGTTTPLLTIGIPGNASDNILALLGLHGKSIAFATGLTLAATTGFADNDTGAPGDNEVGVNIFYQ